MIGDVVEIIIVFIIITATILIVMADYHSPPRIRVIIPIQFAKRIVILIS